MKFKFENIKNFYFEILGNDYVIATEPKNINYAIVFCAHTNKSYECTDSDDYVGLYLDYDDEEIRDITPQEAQEILEKWGF